VTSVVVVCSVLAVVACAIAAVVIVKRISRSDEYTYTSEEATTVSASLDTDTVVAHDYENEFFETNLMSDIFADTCVESVTTGTVLGE
jgi:hypothetical protein